jgi:enterochelin esterase-like enzyme
MKLRLTALSALLATALLSLAPATARASDDTLPEGFDKQRDVPHGKVATEEYDSKSLGLKRKLTVYTPPGYSQDKK